MSGRRFSLDGSHDARARRGPFVRRLVVEKSTGQMIGRVGLHDWPVWDAVELGYVIRADRQGRGFAREASLAWLGWADRALDAGALIAVIQPENRASIQLAARLGFVHDRSDVTPNGVDVEIYRRERQPADAPPRAPRSRTPG